MNVRFLSALSSVELLLVRSCVWHAYLEVGNTFIRDPGGLFTLLRA